MNTIHRQQDDRALGLTAPENLANVRIILVETRTPGNVGATARAMKVMGLSQLVLVNPTPFREAKEARYLACSAVDLVDGARVVNTLEEALEGLHFLVGTTHRQRSPGVHSVVPVREAAARIAEVSQTHVVGVLFGREDSGLRKEELGRCQLTATIPAVTRRPSLNLSHAVQVFAYEILLASQRELPTRPFDYATLLDLESFYQRLVGLMMRMGFEPRTGDPERFVRLLRRIFSRTGLEKRDVAVMQQVCQVMEEYLVRQEREKGKKGNG